MSKAKQTQKNMLLSEKLSQFLMKTPKMLKRFPSETTFVVFSKKDKNLNEENTKLVNSLTKEGRTVIQAIETSDSKSPWKFTKLSV